MKKPRSTATDFALDLQTCELALQSSAPVPRLIRLETCRDDSGQICRTAAREKFRQFRQAGAKLAIDDVGTGYSALSYLRKFEVDDLLLRKTHWQPPPCRAFSPAYRIRAASRWSRLQPTQIG